MIPILHFPATTVLLISFILASITYKFAAMEVKEKGNIKFVNPQIGTDGEDPQDYGGMIPSTAPPFAMTRWTPMTRYNKVSVIPYFYKDDAFLGFLGTHQPALWMGESGQVAISIGTGNLQVSSADRGSTFSHREEVSYAHYYSARVDSVATDDGGDYKYSYTAELTGTSRVGYMRFTFDRSDRKISPYVTVEATREGIVGGVYIDPLRREISGWNPERQDSNLGPSTATNFKGYFVARFDRDFSDWGVASGPEVVFEGGLSLEGSQAVSAYVRFSDQTESVGVRCGVSYISIEQARINLDSEVPDGTSLEETSDKLAEEWSEKLDLIEITNATEDQSAVFYTAMFHALQYPNEMSERNSSGWFYYSGYDDSVHAGDNAYTGYSIWDIFRAEWAFLILFAPERINGFVTSMLQAYQQGGRLPMWQNLVETNIMIGTHSSSLIAEALAKGFDGFDRRLAWEAVLNDAIVPPEDDLTTSYYDREEGVSCEARAGLTLYQKNGWVPAIRTSEAGSRTLEYAYDDYTVSVIASILGHSDEAEFFLNRSLSYKNIFNQDTGFMEARYENGSWCSDSTTWTEGNEWIYTFNVQHDFTGLRALFGGAKGLEDKLDSYFSGGHNDQKNEPSHATAYAYLYAEQPSKAQSTLRTLLSENYFNAADGISGQEDCGQMSSWFMFNALGLYPVNPASGEYLIGSPIFDEVKIHFPGRRSATITLSAADVSSNEGKKYVRGVTLDGKQLESPVLKHSELLEGSLLSFDMSEVPQEWGKGSL